jgi:hypothetical protein
VRRNRYTIPNAPQLITRKEQAEQFIGHFVLKAKENGTKRALIN